jgi:hypothetical protein
MDQETEKSGELPKKPKRIFDLNRVGVYIDGIKCTPATESEIEKIFKVYPEIELK